MSFEFKDTQHIQRESLYRFMRELGYTPLENGTWYNSERPANTMISPANAIRLHNTLPEDWAAIELVNGGVPLFFYPNNGCVKFAVDLYTLDRAFSVKAVEKVKMQQAKGYPMRLKPVHDMVKFTNPHYATLFGIE